MKLTLLTCGLCLSLFATIVGLQSEFSEVDIGIFLLAGMMLLAAALWRSEGLGEGHFRAMQRLYSALASGPIEMDALIKQLVGKYENPSAEEFCQSVIGRMLATRQLVITDGLVTIGEGADYDTWNHKFNMRSSQYPDS